MAECPLHPHRCPRYPTPRYSAFRSPLPPSALRSPLYTPPIPTRPSPSIAPRPCGDSPVPSSSHPAFSSRPLHGLGAILPYPHNLLRRALHLYSPEPPPWPSPGPAEPPQAAPTATSAATGALNPGATSATPGHTPKSPAHSTSTPPKSRPRPQYYMRLAPKGLVTPPEILGHAHKVLATPS